MAHGYLSPQKLKLIIGGMLVCQNEKMEKRRRAEDSIEKCQWSEMNE
jgi:hypothetical protein